jgi:hypothetical protein
MGTTWVGVTSRETAAVLWANDRILVRKPGAGNEWATIREATAWGKKIILRYVFADGTEDSRRVSRAHMFTARLAA